MRQPLTIGLTESQEAELLKLKLKTGYSQSAIIRCALDRFLRTTRNQCTRWAIEQIKSKEDGQSGPKRSSKRENPQTENEPNNQQRKIIALDMEARGMVSRRKEAAY